MSNRSCSLIQAATILLLASGAVFAQDVRSPASGSLPVISLAPQASAPMPQLPPALADGSKVDYQPPQAQVPTKPMAYPQPPRGPIQGPQKFGKKPEQGQSQRPSIAIGLDEDRESSSRGLSPGDVLDPPATILPEATTAVKLSSTDLNRIICTSGDVKEALTSDEKGLMIKITGKDVFVKYKVGKRSDGKLSYSTTPTEIYIVCGENTYSMIAFPDRMPSQTIRLSSGIEDRAKENQSLYEGLPFEKRVMRLIKEVYTDSIPESYTVRQRNEAEGSWKSLNIVLKREVDVEGEGMHLKEYHLTLKPSVDVVKLSEKMFIRKEFAINPIAVSIDKHNLKKGEMSRLFIVEQRADQPLGGNGLSQFMSIDGVGGVPESTTSPVPNSSSARMPQLSRPMGSIKPRGAIPAAGGVQ